jgi:cytoskeletal protein RodZ
MFEIGPALREARERRGLGLPQVEADTKIRARYIRALEDEEFGILPGATYTKGFLRAYAEYLGMDGQLFIDEFNSRHFDPRREDESIYSQPRSRPAPRHRPRRQSSVAMIALAAIVAVSALVFLAMSSGGGPTGNTMYNPSATPPSSSPPTGTTPQSTPPPTSTTKRRPAAFRVTIAATTSACWVQVLRGPAGPAAVTLKGASLAGVMLQPGQSVSFLARKPVYARIGKPGAISLTVAGRPRDVSSLPTPARVRIGRAALARA